MARRVCACSEGNVDGEDFMNEVLGVVALFIPLFLVVWLANLAEARRERDEDYQVLARIAYIFLGALYLIGILGGLLLQLAAVALQNEPTLFQQAGVEIEFASMPLLAVGIWLPSLLGLILLVPPVRKLVARFTDLDAASPVHAVALSLSMLVLINLLVTLGVGIGNFADIVAEGEPTSGDATMLSLWAQQILTALLAAVGVGWLTRRSWAATLARLGLVMPSPREWLIGIGFGLGMVPAVLLLESLASLMGMAVDADVERLSEQLLGTLFTSPLGILTIGLSAGLGEETLFRGALQPRFGLLLTAIFFALVHSQYGITLSTAVVLLLGFVLGWQRLRYNTSTAMITHAVYNMTLGLIAYLSVNLLEI